MLYCKREEKWDSGIAQSNSREESRDRSGEEKIAWKRWEIPEWHLSTKDREQRCVWGRSRESERCPQDTKLDNSDIFENIEGKYRQMGEFEIEFKSTA